ncbi:hypothetical protein HYH03_007214 [Edaphochlamys debaryana]|uniref:Uncharacterized protein n=1 Tax=Edaphochlamys debaryana TaxID=47281 RepID=A0A836C0N8_9CHLO|nr:hypothetical protein HYH03_007214 [Edaphochlamys debaryana]|eukprot:KAG2494698.1 hypothetical protein HYH03_007214 [Edaphochlamys debaryana]
MDGSQQPDNIDDVACILTYGPYREGSIRHCLQDNCYDRVNVYVLLIVGLVMLPLVQAPLAFFCCCARPPPGVPFEGDAIVCCYNDRVAVSPEPDSAQPVPTAVPVVVGGYPVLQQQPAAAYLPAGHSGGAATTAVVPFSAAGKGADADVPGPTQAHAYAHQPQWPKPPAQGDDDAAEEEAGGCRAVCCLLGAAPLSEPLSEPLPEPDSEPLPEPLPEGERDCTG